MLEQSMAFVLQEVGCSPLWCHYLLPFSAVLPLLEGTGFAWGSRNTPSDPHLQLHWSAKARLYLLAASQD